MGAGRAGLRRAVSVAFVTLFFAGLLYAVRAPSPSSRNPAVAASRRAPGPYHPVVVRPVPREDADPCLACHGPTPHARRPGQRAFLNLHVERMECGACHLRSVGLTYRRSARPGGRIAAGREEAGRWTAPTWPEEAGGLRTRGPTCAECHRRGSAILESGAFDAYRKRILEELALLYRLREGAP